MIRFSSIRWHRLWLAPAVSIACGLLESCIPTDAALETKVPAATAIDTLQPDETISPSGEPTPMPTELADVLSVQVSGEENAYRFAVEIRSPDTGCDQYADWWEVLTEDGDLIYRRILAHSHPDEQPFTRSGGPVDIDSTRVVIIRAHMHPDGFGGNAMTGSAVNGFISIDIAPDFSAHVATENPLPDGCAF